MSSLRQPLHSNSRSLNTHTPIETGDTPIEAVLLRQLKQGATPIETGRYAKRDCYLTPIETGKVAEPVGIVHEFERLQGTKYIQNTYELFLRRN